VEEVGGERGVRAREGGVVVEREGGGGLPVVRVRRGGGGGSGVRADGLERGRGAEGAPERRGQREAAAVHRRRVRFGGWWARACGLAGCSSQHVDRSLVDMYLAQETLLLNTARANRVAPYVQCNGSDDLFCRADRIAGVLPHHPFSACCSTSSAIHRAPCHCPDVMCVLFRASSVSDFSLSVTYSDGTIMV
jgi:hypothetical protein